MRRIGAVLGASVAILLVAALSPPIESPTAPDEVQIAAANDLSPPAYETPAVLDMVQMVVIDETIPGAILYDPGGGSAIALVTELTVATGTETHALQLIALKSNTSSGRDPGGGQALTATTYTGFAAAGMDGYTSITSASGAERALYAAMGVPQANWVLVPFDRLRVAVGNSLIRKSHIGERSVADELGFQLGLRAL